jgi:hypothetical protein
MKSATGKLIATAAGVPRTVAPAEAREPFISVHTERYRSAPLAFDDNGQAVIRVGSLGALGAECHGTLREPATSCVLPGRASIATCGDDARMGVVCVFGYRVSL